MTASQPNFTRTVSVGTHSLRVAAEGSGPRQFLALHGLVDSLHIWDRLAPSLAERGRVVRYDQRGHGESEAPPGPYSREDLATDAIRVMDALEIDKAILLGHSMGGIVSMATALAYPDRVAGLLLIGTASHCNEKTAGWYEKIAAAGEDDGCVGLARAIYGPKSNRTVAGDAQGISHVTRMLKTLHSEPLTPRLVAIACPALMLVGEKDPMGPRASERIAEAMPADARSLEVVPGGGHWIHVEAPDVVITALDSWLSTAGL